VDEKQRIFCNPTKANAEYEVLETKRKHERVKNVAMVLKDETIGLEYVPEDESGKRQNKKRERVTLRRVCHQDELNRYYVFLNNNFEIPAEEVAFLYKKRWGIELLFKKMKQNFRLHFFYGENETAIRTQIWCTLMAQLLLTVLQRKSRHKKGISHCGNFSKNTFDQLIGCL
jgi:IS4 transposase